MALLTDDQDIRETYLRTYLSGNGDFYIEIKEISGGFASVSTVRVATSGGNAPSEVKIAVAELYRAMEKAGLNDFKE